MLLFIIFSLSLLILGVLIYATFHKDNPKWFELILFVLLVLILIFYTDKDFGYKLERVKIKHEYFSGDNYYLIDDKGDQYSLTSIRDYSKWKTGKYDLRIVKEKMVFSSSYVYNGELELVLKKSNSK